MCSPALATLAVTAVSAYGQAQQGKAQQEIANVQAESLDQAAQRTAEAGAVAAQNTQLKVKKLISTQTAIAGASGADVSSQSFKNVMADTAEAGAVDAATTQMNYLREAWGLTTQAKGARYTGEAAKLAGKSQAIGTALTGFGTAYGMKTKAGGWT